VTPATVNPDEFQRSTAVVPVTINFSHTDSSLTGKYILLIVVDFDLFSNTTRITVITIARRAATIDAMIHLRKHLQ
jgi:hypothetical protein